MGKQSHRSKVYCLIYLFLSVLSSVKIVLRKQSDECIINQNNEGCFFSTFVLPNKQFEFLDIEQGKYHINAIVENSNLVSNEVHLVLLLILFSQKSISVSAEDNISLHVMLVLTEPSFVLPKPPFSIWSLLKNPMVLLLIPGVLLAVVIPKMTENYGYFYIA